MLDVSPTGASPLASWLLSDESPFELLLADRGSSEWRIAEEQFALGGAEHALPFILDLARSRRVAFMLKPGRRP